MSAIGESPGGCDYDNAWVCFQQATSEEHATQIAKGLGLDPPAMASVMTVAEFQQACKNSRRGKKSS